MLIAISNTTLVDATTIVEIHINDFNVKYPKAGEFPYKITIRTNHISEKRVSKSSGEDVSTYKRDYHTTGFETREEVDDFINKINKAKAQARRGEFE